MPHEHPNKIIVLHATAPTCWWSWGYESVLNKLRLVYGDQIDLRLLTLCVYEDFNDWMEKYEIKSWKENLDWAKEASEIMKVPMETNMDRKKVPKNVMPASIAVIAAKLQGEKKAERLSREILRRLVVEQEDVSDTEVLLDAAKDSGLDLVKFKKDFADKKAREHEYIHQQENFPHHLPLNFYNIVVTDGANRVVLLDHAFEPKIVEDAIDYLSAGKLKKNKPSDILAYLKEHGPTPLIEVSRVFDLNADEAKKKLTDLEKSGKVQSMDLIGFQFWKTK